MGEENRIMAEPVQTLTKTFTHFNILTVKVGTNTPKGGDAGHGGITVLELIDDGGTCWRLIVENNEGKQKVFSSCLDGVTGLRKFKLELLGDAEAETFLKALDFSVKTLKLQRGEL